MSEQCPRTLEVEPLFDCRLDQAASADMHAHLATCVSCRGSFDALGRLRGALRETAALPNAFAMKRLRRETIERAQNGSAAPRLRPSFARLGAVLAALSLVVAAIFGFRVWLRPTISDDVTVLAGPGASFSREEDGTKNIVRLTDGAFDFDVHTHADGRRLLVVVPDGEIEDIGTQFRVVVAGGVTAEIVVSSGEVEFRKSGAAPLRLIAGMTYHPLSVEPRAEASEHASPALPAPADVQAPGPAPTATTSTIAAAPAAVAMARPPAPVDATPQRPAARSTQARRSLAARGAAKSAAPVVEPEPPPAHGPSAEDASYMRIIRLLRAGDMPEARSAARAYLAAFPAGLRRSEVEATLAPRGKDE